MMLTLCGAAEVPMPTFAAYGASKAALAVFSRAMRLELSQWGVEVVLIQPAGFRTSRCTDPPQKVRLPDLVNCMDVASTERESHLIGRLLSNFRLITFQVC